MLSEQTLNQIIDKFGFLELIIDNQLYKNYTKEQLDQELESIEILQNKIREELNLIKE